MVVIETNSLSKVDMIIRFLLPASFIKAYKNVTWPIPSLGNYSIASQRFHPLNPVKRLLLEFPHILGARILPSGFASLTHLIELESSLQTPSFPACIINLIHSSPTLFIKSNPPPESSLLMKTMLCGPASYASSDC